MKNTPEAARLATPTPPTIHRGRSLVRLDGRRGHRRRLLGAHVFGQHQLDVRRFSHLGGERLLEVRAVRQAGHHAVRTRIDIDGLADLDLAELDAIEVHAALLGPVPTPDDDLRDARLELLTRLRDRFELRQVLRSGLVLCEPILPEGLVEPPEVLLAARDVEAHLGRQLDEADILELRERGRPVARGLEGQPFSKQTARTVELFLRLSEGRHGGD
jgi:hypothetical protein